MERSAAHRDSIQAAHGDGASVLPGPPPGGPPAARLGLWDVVSIIVGIVVGAGIYETPPLVLQNVSGPWEALGLWALGGLLSLIGACCYAELATTYPQSGGDYVYLSRAYGSWLGFLFAWVELVAVRAGNIGMMAFVFADYAAQVWGVPAPGLWLWAAGALVVLTALNLLGLVFGKGTQNVLSAAKVLGLASILVAGFAWPSAPSAPAGAPPEHASLSLAMIFVLLTYGGWNDAAFVAAEVRGGPRNIWRALLLGTAIVTLLYVLVNAAYLWALGFEGARDAKAIAAQVLGRPLGEWGARAMAVLVMVSALGAVNGMIFSGSRVYSRMGADQPLFAWLGRWERRTGVPWVSVLAQATLSLVMVAVIGTAGGRGAIDALLVKAGQPPAKWEGHGGFEILLACTAPLFWTFFLLTGLSLFVLRWRDRGARRPFPVPLYPLLPLVFCGTCAYMLHGALQYVDKVLGLLAGVRVLAGLLVGTGLVLYFSSRRLARAGQGPP
jgi:amino acid transporter